MVWRSSLIVGAAGILCAGIAFADGSSTLDAPQIKTADLSDAAQQARELIQAADVAIDNLTRTRNEARKGLDAIRVGCIEAKLEEMQRVYDLMLAREQQLGHSQPESGGMQYVQNGSTTDIAFVVLTVLSQKIDQLGQEALECQGGNATSKQLLKTSYNEDEGAGPTGAGELPGGLPPDQFNVPPPIPEVSLDPSTTPRPASPVF